jgi:hypothetical protein
VPFLGSAIEPEAAGKEGGGRPLRQLDAMLLRWDEQSTVQWVMNHLVIEDGMHVVDQRPTGRGI